MLRGCYYEAELYFSYLGGGDKVDGGSLAKVTLTLPQQVGYSFNKKELILANINSSNPISKNLCGTVDNFNKLIADIVANRM